MVLLGKDFRHTDVTCTEFLVNGSTLRFVSADGGRSLHLHGFHRDHPDSWNGRKLIPESIFFYSFSNVFFRGSFHVGHGMTRMLRMRLLSVDNVNRQAALYGSLEGSIGFLAPIWDEALYHRLVSLQHQLTFHLPHASGLNPMSFRNAYDRPSRPSTCGFFRQGDCALNAVVLDLDLVWRYLHLNRIEQESLAQKCGTLRKQLIQDIQNVALMTSFF